MKTGEKKYPTPWEALGGLAGKGIYFGFNMGKMEGYSHFS